MVLYLKCLIEAIGYEKQQLYKEAYTKYKESIPLIDNEMSNVDYIILKRDINSKIEQLEIIEMQKNSNENINNDKIVISNKIDIFNKHFPQLKYNYICSCTSPRQNINSRIVKYN